MTRRMFKQITAQVDTREKPGHEWLFPAHIPFKFQGAFHHVAVKPVRVRLPEGDYCGPPAQMGEWSVGFERKASIRELYCNLLGASREQARARDAFTRFSQAFYRPIVVATVSPVAFTRNHLDRVLDISIHGGLVFDALTEICAMLGMELWIVGACRSVSQRRAMGSLVARTLLYYRLKEGGYLDGSSI